MTTVSTLWQIFGVFLKLGCTSFGGPIAHIGFFRTEFVMNKGWMSERDYFDLVALCQFLPGPASSQVGMAIGLQRAGYFGAFIAWLGFTLPSALLMLALAQGLTQFSAVVPAGLLHGLKLAACAIIAHAVFAMAKSYCQSLSAGAIAALSLLMLSISSASFWQVLTIFTGALLGIILLKTKTLATEQHQALNVNISKKAGLSFAALFILLLIGLPIASNFLPSPALNSIDAFFRAGSLVFGGGHAVLPMLQADFVGTGAVTADRFIAGYGAVQAVPGPLFTFAGFLGASVDAEYLHPMTGVGMVGGILGGVIALIAIFAPAFLLIGAILPFWQLIRNKIWMQKAMAGIGASVVAILINTLYHPVLTSSILSVNDGIIAAVAFLALQFAKVTPWQLVVAAAVLGGLSSGFVVL